MPDDSSPLLTGAALIKDQVRRLPDAPGVYRMFGEGGESLYVGKARSLKKRVIQYAQGRFHTNRIALMVDLTRSMEFTTTRTETDALLLEINLIKQLKPRFNVLLRDDKSFPEIVIRREHPAAQLRKHRGAHTIKGDYFGPFASAWAVNRTLNTLQKAFLLRSCSDSVYESRTRPCMLHQIRRCSAPCTGLISLEDYQGLVGEAEAFLRGKSRMVMQHMSEQMQAASDDMEFERAARLRDRIRALASIAQETQINAEDRGRGPTSSPCTPRAARPASRSSSSAPARIGATAPTSPASTSPTATRRSWPRFWGSSTRTSRSPG